MGRGDEKLLAVINIQLYKIHLKSEQFKTVYPAPISHLIFGSKYFGRITAKGQTLS